MKQITSAIKQKYECNEANYECNKAKYECNEANTKTKKKIDKCNKARYNDKICAMKPNYNFSN